MVSGLGPLYWNTQYDELHRDATPRACLGAYGQIVTKSIEHKIDLDTLDRRAAKTFKEAFFHRKEKVQKRPSVEQSEI